MQKEPRNTIPRLNLRPHSSHSLIIDIISYAKMMSSIPRKNNINLLQAIWSYGLFYLTNRQIGDKHNVIIIYGSSYTVFLSATFDTVCQKFIGDF